MPEHFPGRTGVQAERLGVGEGFRGDRDVHPAEQLVDELDLLPLAGFGTDDGGIAGHHVQQRLHGGQRGLRAADHDQQITLPGPGGATGNRGVDDLHAGHRQAPRPVLDGSGSDGGHQQHNAARFECRGGLAVAVEHRFGLIGGGDHQHQHIGVGRRVTDGGRGLDAVAGEGHRLLRVDVEGRDRVSGLGDERCHGGTHGSQTDPSDVGHSCCLLLR